MKRFLYGERDYTFGEAMLTLRTALGLTQAGLAEHLSISRRAVAEWEAGSSYPKAEHLKQLIALGVRQQAFPTGREVEEIGAALATASPTGAHGATAGRADQWHGPRPRSSCRWATGGLGRRAGCAALLWAKA